MSRDLVAPDGVVTLVQKAQRRFSAIAKKNGELVNWQTEKSFALQILAASDLLQKCVPESITNSVVNVAAIGLSLNPQRKHCALIPRYDSKHKVYVCHADPMYQGLIAIGATTGSIENCWGDVVREEDVRQGHFHYEGGTNPRVTFNPNPFESPEKRGAIIGAFVVIDVPGARNPHVTFMRIEDIIAIRDRYSEAWKYKVKMEKKHPGQHYYGGPWESAPEEMIKKTVLKRSAKTWPNRSLRLDNAIAMSDAAEVTFERRETDIEGEAVEVVTKEQAAELTRHIEASHVRPERVLKRFDVKRIEDLPVGKYQTCLDLLRHSELIYILRTATKETRVYAADHGMSPQELEDLAAEHQSKATLLSAREGDDGAPNGND